MRYFLKVMFLLLALVFVASGTPFYTDTINLDMDLQHDPDETASTAAFDYSLIDYSNTFYRIDLWIETGQGFTVLDELTSEQISANLLLDGEIVHQLTLVHDRWTETESENNSGSVTYSNSINLEQETLDIPDGTYELLLSTNNRQLTTLEPLSIPLHFASLTEYQPATNHPPGTNSLGLRLYYPDASSKYLIPITRFVPQTNTTLRETVVQLEAGPSPLLGLFDRSPIPPVPRIQLSGGTASLYLSSQLGFYNEYPNVAQMAAASLVESLGSIPEVSRIQFYFDNRIVDEGFVSVSTGSVIEPSTPPFIFPVYRSSNGRGLLIPFPVQSAEANVQNIVHALTFKHNKSFYNSELQPTLPSDIELLDYSMENGTLMVNFNQAFTQHVIDYPHKGRIMIDSLLLSLTSLVDVERVIFRVNGQVPLVSTEQPLGQPLFPPAFINPENP